MRFKKTAGDRRRGERLKALPSLAIEFSRLMTEVFGERAPPLSADAMKERRERAAAIAKIILADMEELRWDPGISPEMRRLLDATRRKMLSDKRIKGLLKDAGALPASA